MGFIKQYFTNRAIKNKTAVCRSIELNAEQIAQILGGTIEGDKNAIVTDFARIEEGKAKAISFLANPKYIKYIYETESSIVLINNDFVPERKVKTTLIRVENAYQAVAKLLNYYSSLQNKPTGIAKKSQLCIHKTAKIGNGVYIGSFVTIERNVVIGDNVKIYPGVYIGNDVIIGNNTTIYPNVSIYYNTEIGENCIIHSGSVIGADGFGFAPVENGEFLKISQIGNVVIENNVEIGALVTIDRATMGSTIIRKGVKLDDHNHIAHNVEVGENTVIAAQGGFAGSSKIGKNCMFGGQIGVAPHTSVADRTSLGAKTGVASNIRKEGQTLLGEPAIDAKDYIRAAVHFKNLDKIVKRLDKLEKLIEANHIVIPDNND